MTRIGLKPKRLSPANCQKTMEPITKDQLEFVKAEINNAYLHLIGKSQIDPVVIELMKLSALAEAQRRCESKDPW